MGPRRVLQGADPGAVAPPPWVALSWASFPQLLHGCSSWSPTTASFFPGVWHLPRLGMLIPTFSVLWDRDMVGWGPVKHAPPSFSVPLQHLLAASDAGAPWVGCAGGTSPALRGLVSSIDHTCTVTM